MKYDFDKTVRREGMGNLKAHVNTEAIASKGFINYWGAEFDFKTAPAITTALSELVENGLFGFTICTDLYLNRVKWWLETQRDYLVNSDWIVPTYGTIFSLATTIRAFSEIEDYVIVLSPGYNRYISTAYNNRRRVLESKLIDDGVTYLIDFDDLQEKMSFSKSKILVLCNPNNPTGTIWKKEDLEKIDRLAFKNEITVFSDEIFADVYFNHEGVIPYSKIANINSKTITCTSLGKAFSMTGINHANAIIPNDMVRNKFCSQKKTDHFGSIDPFAHAAMLGAYTSEGANWLQSMRSYVFENYLYIKGFFKLYFPEIIVRVPEGTYVLWIDFRGLGLEKNALNNFLVNDALLMLDNGEEYGGDSRFMRMNIAAPQHEIKKSLNYLLAISAK